MARTTLQQSAQSLSSSNTTTQLRNSRTVTDTDATPQTTILSHVPTDHHTVPALPQIQPRTIPPAPAPAPNNHAPTNPVRQIQTLPDQTVHSGAVVSVLDPNATPFVSHGNTQDATGHVTGHTQQKTKPKAKRNNPPTDKASTQIEFLKLEISTLQAKLQKQDDDLKDLKYRNNILMTRNKSLEELKQQEIHEKYFPSQGPHVQNNTGACTGHGHGYTCCVQPVCHSRQHVCSTTHHNQCSGQNTEIELINDKLEDLSRSLQKQQQALDSLLHLSEVTWPRTDSDTPPAAPPSQTPPGTSLSSSSPPPSQPLPISPMMPSGQADNSAISLDGFMFGEECDNEHLN